MPTQTDLIGQPGYKPTRNRKHIRVLLVKSLIKYFIVGGICFLIDFSLFYWLASINTYHYLLVNLLSFSLATACNYLLCIVFVFNSGLKYTKKTELLLVFFVSGFSLAVNQAILYALVELLSFNLPISKALSILMTFLINFFGRRNFVFHDKS